MKPIIKEMSAMKFVGCSERIDLVNGDFAGVGKAWEKLFPSMHKIQNIIHDDQFWGVTAGLFQADNSYTAARLVSEIQHEDIDFKSFDIPPQQFAVFEHKGNPMTMGKTIQDALEWLHKSEFELNGNFNLEMYDSRCNPEEPDAYIVDIFFPVNKKTQK